MQNNEVLDLQGEYEDLLIEFETQVATYHYFCSSIDKKMFFLLYNALYFMQRTLSEIQIDCLTRKLADADMFSVEICNDYSTSCVNKGTINGDKNVSSRESEAILVIKRLQEHVVLSFYFNIFLFLYIYIFVIILILMQVIINI